LSCSDADPKHPKTAWHNHLPKIKTATARSYAGFSVDEKVQLSRLIDDLASALDSES